jgi:hypothetical protein
MLTAWDANGHVTAQLEPRSGTVIVTEDPLGGIATWRGDGANPVLENYDPQLHLRWRVTLPVQCRTIGDCTDWIPAALAVDRAGKTLVLLQSLAQPSSRVTGMWIDHDGTTGPVFEPQVPQDRPGFALFPRVGSGLFLLGGGKWIGQFDSLATTMAPPPDWLVSKGWLLHVVHGGTGYAFVTPFPFKNSCTQTIEVVAASGKSCGTATFASNDGSCSSAAPLIGYDGTVVLDITENAAQCQHGVTCTCTWEWWPAFFH